MTSASLFFKLQKEDLKRRIWVIALLFLGFFFAYPVNLALTMENAANSQFAMYNGYTPLVDTGTPEYLAKVLEYKTKAVVDLVSYGNNIMAASIPETMDLVSAYVDKFEFYHCFETPNMHWLNERLAEKGHKICFMAEYYLPDISRIPTLSCAYVTRVLTQEAFADLYRPEWGNALCEDRKNLDVLGVGAYDGSTLVGLAACSADCDDMWQIGVDVLPEYRRKGIASALTSRLTKEILNRGKVPFYCTAWSNVRSVRNAVKSGFIPAWVEMTAKPANIVDEMNL